MLCYPLAGFRSVGGDLGNRAEGRCVEETDLLYKFLFSVFNSYFLVGNRI